MTGLPGQVAWVRRAAVAIAVELQPRPEKMEPGPVALGRDVGSVLGRARGKPLGRDRGKALGSARGKPLGRDRGFGRRGGRALLTDADSCSTVVAASVPPAPAVPTTAVNSPALSWDKVADTSVITVVDEEVVVTCTRVPSCSTTMKPSLVASATVPIASPLRRSRFPSETRGMGIVGADPGEMPTLVAAICAPEEVPRTKTCSPSVMSARLPVVSRVNFVADEVATVTVRPPLVVRTRSAPLTRVRMPPDSSLEPPEQPVAVSPAVLAPVEFLAVFPAVLPAEAPGDSAAPADL